MARRGFFILSTAIISCVFLAGAVLILQKNRESKEIILVSPVASDSFTVLLPTRPPVSLVKTDEPTPIPKKINILLLGLDGRKGDYKPRCDAIHMITIDPFSQKIRITSIPRGTPVEIPDVAKESAYISNSCHILGIDYAIGEAEKMTGLKRDYLVKLGFSQALGIFRTLGLPATDTLEFLRNRHLAGGDVQRTKNQAQFMKDMIIKHLHTYSNIPKPIRYLLFRLVDTDMEFEKASDIVDEVLAMEVDRYPERIELTTKPTGLFAAKEMHLGDISAPESTDSAEEFAAYQNEIEVYLGNLLYRGDALLKRNQTWTVYQFTNTPFHQQLWLQLADENKRHQWHFALLRLFALSTPNKNERNTLVLDFITEMEALNLPEYEQQGKTLFASLK